MKIKEPLVPELYRHFRHILSDLLRIMIRTGANGAEAVRRQDPAVQFVSPGLPVSFMLPVRNLLQEYLRQHHSPLRYSAKNPTHLLTGAFYQPPLSKKQRFDCSAALKLQTGLMISTH